MLTYYAIFIDTDGRETVSLRRTRKEAEAEILRQYKVHHDVEVEDLKELENLLVSRTDLWDNYYFIGQTLLKIEPGSVPVLLRASGDHKAECPKCGHDGDMEFGSIEYDGDSHWQEVTCPVCEAKYRDVYQFAGREDND